MDPTPRVLRVYSKFSMYSTMYSKRGKSALKTGNPGCRRCPKSTANAGCHRAHNPKVRALRGAPGHPVGVRRTVSQQLLLVSGLDTS